MVKTAAKVFQGLEQDAKPFPRAPRGRPRQLWAASKSSKGVMSLTTLAPWRLGK